MQKNRCAVIVIDMLEDFIYGPLKNDRAKKIIPPIAKLLTYARKLNWVVVYANDAHVAGDPEEAVWGKHALANSPGAQVIKKLSPQKGDFVIGKRTYSAFYETGLDGLLRQHTIDTVILSGQHTHICVRHTAADAFIRNYKIIVPSDCVEAFSDDIQHDGLEYLKMCYGAKITVSIDFSSSI